ncbi:MAG: hypothetical protein IT373_29840 [Polyangiaceae bacterium]|nr:hypothetical protein [Polyangiaceae bacterium]
MSQDPQRPADTPDAERAERADTPARSPEAVEKLAKAKALAAALAAESKSGDPTDYDWTGEAESVPSASPATADPDRKHIDGIVPVKAHHAVPEAAKIVLSEQARDPRRRAPTALSLARGGRGEDLRTIGDGEIVDVPSDAGSLSHGGVPAAAPRLPGAPPSVSAALRPARVGSGPPPPTVQATARPEPGKSRLPVVLAALLITGGAAAAFAFLALPGPAAPSASAGARDPATAEARSATTPSATVAPAPSASAPDTATTSAAADPTASASSATEPSASATPEPASASSAIPPAGSTTTAPPSTQTRPPATTATATATGTKTGTTASAKATSTSTWIEIK